MKLFVDTSFFLSIVFEEPGSELAEEYLQDADSLLGSFLLQIETIQSIHRRCLLFQKDPKPFLDRALEILGSFELTNWSNACLQKLQTIKEIRKLKSLDAIHFSTYLVLEKESGIQNLYLATNDDQLLSVAKSLKIPTVSNQSSVSTTIPIPKKKKK